MVANIRCNRVGSILLHFFRYINFGYVRVFFRESCPLCYSIHLSITIVLAVVMPGSCFINAARGTIQNTLQSCAHIILCNFTASQQIQSKNAKHLKGVELSCWSRVDADTTKRYEVFWVRLSIMVHHKL